MTVDKHAIITGATGMVGSLVLELCLECDEITRVTSLLRRPSGIQHAKLSEIIVEDWLDLDENASCFESVDIVFYCLGVYSGAVKRDEFRKITVDYPEALARALQPRNPGLSFCLLSGAGADRSERSRIMFARDKGAGGLLRFQARLYLSGDSAQRTQLFLPLDALALSRDKTPR